MKRFITALALFIMCAFFLGSCKEHFSDGERVGTVTKFSKAGVIWDSWDGDLNLTQTGMNSAGEPFSFSFDNDRTDQDSLIELVNEAQRLGWKIKIVYHQVWGFKNVMNNRGESDYFVDDVIVLDKAFSKPLGAITDIAAKSDTTIRLGTADNPLYVVIIKDTNK